MHLRSTELTVMSRLAEASSATQIGLSRSDSVALGLPHGIRDPGLSLAVLRNSGSGRIRSSGPWECLGLVGRAW